MIANLNSSLFLEQIDSLLLVLLPLIKLLIMVIVNKKSYYSLKHQKKLLSVKIKRQNLNNI